MFGECSPALAVELCASSWHTEARCTVISLRAALRGYEGGIIRTRRVFVSRTQWRMFEYELGGCNRRLEKITQ